MDQRTPLQILLSGTYAANQVKVESREKRQVVDMDKERALQRDKAVTVITSDGGGLPRLKDWQSLKDLLDKEGLSKVSVFLDNMITRFNYPEPSLIQAHAIPHLLKGLPVLATAPTGSGKTFAFLFPLLVKLRKPSKKFCRSIILSPTRELAVQIERETRALAGDVNLSIRRAEPKTFKVNTSLKNVDVLIGTPGKIKAILEEVDHISGFPDCETVILDECDRLLAGEGTTNFADQIDGILTACSNTSKQMVMFSATRSQRVDMLAATVLHDPVKITIGNPRAVNDDVKQEIVYVHDQPGKVDFIRRLKTERKLVPPCLIFVDSKATAKGLFHDLIHDQIMVEVLSADRTGAQRDAVIEDFRKGRLWVLICTDVLARGVDFKGVKLVINYNVPESGTNYIHRVGRTGRAGDTGHAITLLSKNDLGIFANTVPVLKESGVELPEILQDVRKLRQLGPSAREKAVYKRNLSQTRAKILKKKAKKERKNNKGAGKVK